MTALASVSRLRAREARQLVAVELQRTLELLRDVTDADWNRPTVCDRWTVRDVLAHLVGEAHDWSGVTTLPRMFVGGRRIARQEGLPLSEGMTEWQVLRRRSRSPDELLAALPAATRRLGRAGRAAAGPLRTLPVPIPGMGFVPLRFVTDELYLRDIWIHRCDMAGALGRPFVLTPQHDSRIVALIAAEWAQAHGRPVYLELRGTAGGIYKQGTAGETLALDAVDFVCVLSGRASHPHALMATKVRF